jgi:hypothetical protein
MVRRGSLALCLPGAAALAESAEKQTDTRGEELIHDQKDGSAALASEQPTLYGSAGSVVNEGSRRLARGAIDLERADAVIARYSGKMTTFCPVVALVAPAPRLSPKDYVLTHDGARPGPMVAIERVCGFPQAPDRTGKTRPFGVRHEGGDMERGEQHT